MWVGAPTDTVLEGYVAIHGGLQSWVFAPVHPSLAISIVFFESFLKITCVVHVHTRLAEHIYIRVHALSSPLTHDSSYHRRILSMGGGRRRTHYPGRLGVCKPAEAVKYVCSIPPHHRAGAVQPADQVLYLADRAFLDELLLAVSPDRQEAPGMIDAEHGSIRLTGGQHPVSVLDCRRQRFLAEDATNPCIGSVDHNLGVPVVRNAHRDDVERSFRSQHLFVICVDAQFWELVFEPVLEGRAHFFRRRGLVIGFAKDILVVFSVCGNGSGGGGSSGGGESKIVAARRFKTGTIYIWETGDMMMMRCRSRAVGR